MAEPLSLDPGDYRGTYKLIGGSPALDFANLVSYRGTPREHDWLVPEGNLAKWASASGVGHVELGAIDRLRRLREALASIFLSIADGEAPDQYDIASVSRLAASARARHELRIVAASRALEWVDPQPTLISLLALDATRLLTSEESMSRIAACDACRWLFLDTTRNRSRRWCDPADCGNRTRQRRHYRRRAEGGSALA